MATYRSIAATETDPQAPITAALVKALDANPTAIAEGATDAPKVVGEALDLIQPFVDTTSTTWGQWTDLGRAEWVEINGYMLAGGAPTGIQLRLSSDNGSTWSTASTVTAATTASGTKAMFRGLVNMKTGDYRFWSIPSGGYEAGTLALTGSPDALGIRADIAASQINADLCIIKGVSP